MELLLSKLKVSLAKNFALISVMAILFSANQSSLVFALPPACAGIEDRQQQLLCIERLYQREGINFLDPAECTPGGTAATPGNAAVPSAPTSLRDKLALLIFARANTAAEISSVSTIKVGGIFVRPSDKNDGATYNSIKSSLNGTAPFIAVDFEGGRVQAPGDALTGGLPSARELGAKSAEEITAIAKEKGAKLKSFGINMDFAPVVDIGGTNNDVIGDRAFANDPTNVTAKAGAFAAGLAESGIISTLKHFPGHGSKEGDSHKVVVATESLQTLEGRDLKPYQTLKNNPKTAIMMGHLRVPDWGDTATSLNPKAYQYIRSSLNFQGLVVTDALNMEGVVTPADEPSRALAAIQAGADMALLSAAGQVAPTLAKLEAAAGSGQLSTARIDEAVTRVINLQRGLTTPIEDQAPAVNGCAPCSPSGSSGGSTVPAGANNQEKAFRFFISKGMAPNQAAGFVANLMMESFPEIKPEALNPDSGAYGIAQWLGGRKTGLYDYAREKGTPAESFDTQIAYLWDVDIPAQINGGFPEIGRVTTNDPAMDIEEATRIITLEFERPGVGERKLERRYGYAHGVLALYGNGTGGSSTTGCGGAGAGTVIDGFVVYNQFDERWANKPYGSSTIQKSGCGPSSIAMVVATLNSDTSVTPETIAAKYGQYYTEDAGSSWDLMKNVPADFGLISQDIGKDMEAAKAAIRNGALVIASGKGASPFTKGGHILVLRGVTPDGKIMIGDSGHRDTSDVPHEEAALTGSIRNMWVISK